MRHGWGVVGVILGLWEASAWATGRLPTVSATVCRARERWPAATDALVLVWAAGTARHLLTYRL